MKNKDLKYYINLPWTYSLETDEDPEGNRIYIISVNELPDLKSDASTISEAMDNIKEAMEAAFELYMDLGQEIPEPINENDFKGNIAYRTSSKRHYLLAKEARKRKLSLSSLLDISVDSILGNNK